MNAASNSNSISTPDFITDDSDSDASSDEIPEYYLPISSSDPDSDANDTHLALDQLSNGHHFPPVIEVEEEEEEPSMLEEEDEMQRQAESESAIRRAFLEDESRRRAPLPSHNAARVMEAMRGVSFSASPPQWAHHLDDHIQRLRPPPSSTA